MNADRIETAVLGQLDELTLDDALLDRSIAAANKSEAEKARPLNEKLGQVQGRLREVEGRIDNLVEAVAAAGKRALASIESKLVLEEQNQRQLELEEAALKTALGEIAGDPLNPSKVRAVLKDFRLLYDVATPVEQKELLRLLIARVKYNGPEEIEISFRAEVTLNRSGSKLRAIQLPDVDSNHGHGD